MSELQIKAEMAAFSIPPPELHGMVCGMACSGAHEFVVAELVELAGPDALSDEAALGEFITAALDGLHDQEMSFVPLIPADDEPMAKRVEAVADWCGGFLAGFAVGIDDEHHNLPVDVQEIIRDLAALSGLDSADYEASIDDVGNEENEAALMEIFEYVRVGTLLVLSLMDEHQTQEGAD